MPWGVCSPYDLKAPIVRPFARWFGGWVVWWWLVWLSLRGRCLWLLAFARACVRLFVGWLLAFARACACVFVLVVVACACVLALCDCLRVLVVWWLIYIPPLYSRVYVYTYINL